MRLLCPLVLGLGPGPFLFGPLSLLLGSEPLRLGTHPFPFRPAFGLLGPLILAFGAPAFGLCLGKQLG